MIICRYNLYAQLMAIINRGTADSGAKNARGGAYRRQRRRRPPRTAPFGAPRVSAYRRFFARKAPIDFKKRRLGADTAPIGATAADRRRLEVKRRPVGASSAPIGGLAPTSALFAIFRPPIGYQRRFSSSVIGAYRRRCQRFLQQAKNAAGGADRRQQRWPQR